MIRSIRVANRHNNNTDHDHSFFFYWFAILFLLVTWLGVPTAAAGPTCQRTCGDVDVPYPFGIGDPSCAMFEADEEFLLSCNSTSEGSRRLFMRRENIQVLEISLEEATLSVSIASVFKCYDGPGISMQDQSPEEKLININGPFTFSSANNKLVSLGCDTLALMQGDNKFGSGCVSMCSENVDLAKEGACSGLGCCQTSLPKNIKSLDIWLGSVYNHSDIRDFNPCDFAMLVDQRTLNVSNLTLGFRPGDPAVTNVSVLLDWIVGNETCEEAQRKGRDYACGDNSDCYYSDNALGYRCKCSSGFTGNPYLKGQEGCTDIDECEEPQRYTCQGKCKNTIGGYDCPCPLGMHGDGKIGNCQGFRVTTVASVAGGSLSVLTISMLIFYDCKRRKREKIFRENGGLVLKHQRVRIFSTKELSKATNNYNEAHLLGKGGFASVYKGVIAKDHNNHPQTTQVVAVKKPKEDHENNKTKFQNKNSQQFHEEIAIVSQVNHKNVVKLLGICLETKTPLLVYEYVSNGTLHNHIHKKTSTVLKPWKNRLKIAVETAFALDYLHSLANPPIIHGDVKSSNILLDENYSAKVSDFGASVLIPPDQTGITTTVQGTLGYLDPEFLNTGTLTTKSDVYSFGVVLVELMTGEKPISRLRTGPKSNIIQYFVSKVLESCGESYADEILDEEIVCQGGYETEQIEAVAELAVRCLEMSGVLRPSMREVAEELARLSKARNLMTEGGSQRLLSNDDLRSSRRNQSSYELIEYTAFDAITDQSSFHTSVTVQR